MQARDIRELWLSQLESEGRSHATLQSYRDLSEGFLRTVEGQELTPFLVRRYLADYRKTHAPASFRSTFITVRLLLRYGVAEKLFPEELTHNLRLPKREEAPKDIYKEGQLKALFAALENPEQAAIPSGRTPVGLRDAAMCAVMLDCGLRVGEMCALETSNMADGALVFRSGKSGRQRAAALGKRSARALHRYLAIARPRLKPSSERLFVGEHGEPMNRWTVAKALKRWSARVGFPVSAHRFRHTWATRMLQSGCDLETLRRLGGWKDYEIILTYLHLADGDLRTAQARHSPLDSV